MICQRCGSVPCTCATSAVGTRDPFACTACGHCVHCEVGYPEPGCPSRHRTKTVDEDDPALARLAELERENERLREALRPFARSAPQFDACADLDPLIAHSGGEHYVGDLRVSDLRRARAVWGGEGERE